MLITPGLARAWLRKLPRVIDRQWVGREDLRRLLYPSAAEREWDAKLIDPQTELARLGHDVVSNPEEEEKGVSEREEEEKKRKEEEEKKKQGGQQPGQPHQPGQGGEQKPGGGGRY